MPIYEYACPKCRTTFEEWLKADDEAGTHPCPACGCDAPRILSPTSFILKGGGWYATEYGSLKGASTGNGGDAAGPDGADGADSAPPASGSDAPGKTAAEASGGTPASSPAATAVGE